MTFWLPFSIPKSPIILYYITNMTNQFRNYFINTIELRFSHNFPFNLAASHSQTNGFLFFIWHTEREEFNWQKIICQILLLPKIIWYGYQEDLISFVFAVNRNVKATHCYQIEHKKIASISFLYGFFWHSRPKMYTYEQMFASKIVVFFCFLVDSLWDVCFLCA